MNNSAGKAITEIDGKDFIVKELTVAQLRSLIGSRTEYEVLRCELYEDVYLHELPAFVDAELEDLEQLRPSQLDVLIAKVKEMNPRFFQMLARLKAPSPAPIAQ
ncbi:hypothetical protein ACUTAF_08215 [Pseudomonas sp. SP16.1]|uniref:hypothetical protein n=1 Tax=Pseudomonas sp. SP16.1 TaxID=3458854 RepID=UPI00404589AE